MKKYILTFILGGLFFGSIGTVVALNYNAKDIEFTPSDSSWNVNNVEDAIKDLKDNKKIQIELLWTNPNPKVSFSAQTINMDISTYKYVVPVINATTEIDLPPRGTSIVPVGGVEYNHVGVNGGSMYRNIKASSSGVYISGCSNNNQSYAIPYKIYGIKDELDIDL